MDPNLSHSPPLTDPDKDFRMLDTDLKIKPNDVKPQVETDAMTRAEGKANSGGTTTDERDGRKSQ